LGGALKIELIPLFVEAKTKKLLVKKMLETNIKAKAHLKYFSIQKDGNKWVAWYYDNINSIEVLNG